MKRRHLKYYLASLVSLATFFVYLGSLRNEFVNWDDPAYVFENSFIRSFDANFFKAAFVEFHAANWHPLTWISHAIDYSMWGQRAFGHHLTNNIFHAVNTFFIVLLTIELINSARKIATTNGHSEFFLTEQGMVAAGITVGLLFGLHPLHVESVAWVSERKDLLCALFFLLSVLSYIKYAGSMHNKATYSKRTLNRSYYLALGFFFLALLSKPMAVSLPFVLIILDWYPFERFKTQGTRKLIFAEKLPFVALSVASSVVTIFAQQSESAVLSFESVRFLKRVYMAGGALTGYLEKALWPANLCPFYPFPLQISFLSVKYLLPILLAIGITAVFIAALKNYKVWLAVWGYYVITLMPVLGIVQIGGQSMADRYMYLPSLGPFLIMGVAAALVYEYVNRDTFKAKKLRALVGLFSAVAIVSMTSLTMRQIHVWRNSVVLWSNVIDKWPAEVPVAYYGRGKAYAEQGQHYLAIEDFGTAITQIGRNPTAYQAYNSRGLSYGQLGLFDDAIQDFKKAIELNPNFDESYNNCGVVYFLKGQYDRAVENYNRAISLNHDNAEAYVNRGYVRRSEGDMGLAKADFQKGCDLGKEAGCTQYLSIKVQ
jgi:hypothetical protein